ncbi:sugar phosphate isomerase/epimerase [Aquirufa rosea]|uniref:Sugar phosphate isomerase/epimerase n=2 Tax=Aquirufa rosea TaxID=2509241 RepID=A0A4Q1BZQ4_9BACT|nr:sugar phosphate isomerase/epimerase [Aquirufa rosea]
MVLAFCLPTLILAKQPNKFVHKKSNSASNAPKDWKLGVALYSFNAFSFPDQLAKADSAGLHYIEGYTFGKAGVTLKDSSIMNLSNSGVKQLKQMIQQKGLKMESIYLVGGKTIDRWKKEFDIAKELQVSYVTAEPPVHLWDGVDSLAALYKIKVAIHNHWKGTSVYWTPDSLLIAMKNHPNFYACPDLGHYPKSGINPVDAIKKLQGRIIAIHLKDIAEYNNPKLRDVPVGTGVIDFPAVFAELKRQGFQGNINLERDTQEKPSNLASIIRSVQYYREQIDKLK